MNKQNVLIIMTDQHTHNLMTCAGNDEIETPNLDRIAANGIRFERAYCPYPVCLASRSSMLTGLYAHNTRAVNNTDKLDWRFRTMAHHFADNGYHTALIGKMHFNDVNNHGFNYYMSINDWLMYIGPKVQHYANEIANHQLMDGFYHSMNDSGAGFPDVDDLWSDPDSSGNPWIGNVDKFDYSSTASELKVEDHLDSFITRESIKFIERYKANEQPFFMISSFMKPHTPFYPPKEYADKYKIEDMDIDKNIGDINSYPEHIRQRINTNLSIDKKRLQAARAGYLGNLAFVDDCIGKLYDYLIDANLLENTLVVYTSDHGEMHFMHGLNQKFCLFENSVRVPFIISQPSNIKTNETCDALINLVDLYPTLADLTNTKLNESPILVEDSSLKSKHKKIDGESFAQCVKDPSLPFKDEVFCEFALKSDNGQYMIRSGKFKYNYNVKYCDELYDLVNDPDEYKNLINDTTYTEIIADLKNRLFNWYDPKYDNTN